MGNILDYIEWRGDISFNASRPNKIDYLIMSQIALIDLDGVVPGVLNKKSITIKEASEKYFDSSLNKSDSLGLIIPNAILQMFKKLKDANRFKDLELSNYVNIIDENGEEQLSAFTCKISKDLMCIAFSGTDDTIVGWKEDLNMIFKSPVSSQLSAVEYVEEVTKDNDYQLIICGHSKGGNLSVYSATHVNEKVQNRIVKVYNFDGPGVSKTLVEEVEYISRLGKVSTIIPQSSVIGKLFEHKEKCTIVKSTSLGLFQHDAFSWQISGKHFVKEPQVTKESELVDKAIRDVLEILTEEEKENFVNKLYNLLISTSSKSLTDLSKRKKVLLENYLKLSRKDRKDILMPLRILGKNRVVRKLLFDSLKASKDFNK